MAAALKQNPPPGQAKAEMADDPPPVFGTWPRLYAFVLFFLAAVIGAFYAFTRYFS